MNARTKAARVMVGGAFLLLASAAQAAAGGGTGAVPLYDDLGEHHYSITTAEPQAQRYFDQGLRLYYAFNHQESIRSFEEAARIDPTCAMCYWGVALAQGPNINAPMDPEAGAGAWAAIQDALAQGARASAPERALIQALASRYAADPPEDRSALDLAYARALGDVVRQFPDDLEAATLYAEALMDLTPWDYWTRDGQPREDTPELLAQLERVMKQDPDHPGANHFYIHAVEAVDPGRAVDAAERLAGLMPGAGHLVHMPAHIYVRVGRYEEAIEANRHAVHADETYIRDQGPAAGIYVLGYYPHNYDFLAFAASMIGRDAVAIESAEKMATLPPQELLREPGMTFMQHHQTRHLQMKVRFGRWDDVLGAEAPPDDLAHARAMWHYARGRALAATGKVEAADAELTQLRRLSGDPALAEQALEFNTSGTVLNIASLVLAGHIAAERRDFVQAVTDLRDAAGLEDEMVYGEPPEWSVPVRQDLGDILLRAGRAAEAEKTYREDLRRFPENIWSTRGLSQAMELRERS